MKKKTPLALAMGTTLLSGLAATANVSAQTLEDSFSMTELNSGYMQLAANEETSKAKEGACGEGKCGSAMMSGSEEKMTEGNCAGNKPMPTDTKKSPEGKCGEGKCGEGKCGAKKK